MGENNFCEHHHGEGTHKACVSLVPIFNHLESQQMDEIMSTVQSAFFKRGEIIYHDGDRSDSLYIVNKGKIRIYRLSETGKEQLVRILNVGDFTGKLALFQDGLSLELWRSNLTWYVLSFSTLSEVSNELV